MGVILMALLIGIAISVISTLQSCIQTHKDEKVRRAQEQNVRAKSKPAPRPDAAKYVVQY